MLDAIYLEDAERRARQFSGAYTGTSGTLAADVIHLLNDRKTILQELTDMTTALDEANQQLRDAVAARLAATPADDPKLTVYDIDEKGPMPEPEEDDEEDSHRIPEDWILRGEQELRLAGDGVLAAPVESGLRPGSSEFIAVLDELRQLHLAKTLDYGIDEDALSNIRSSADVVNMPAWAGCILRMMDKMHRIKAYFRRGRTEFDGIEDTLKDIACYSAIALVLYRESTTRKESHARNL